MDGEKDKPWGEGLLGAEWVWSRHVFESVTNGITVADANTPDMPLIYANPAFSRITGYEVDEVIGRNCRFLQGAETDQPALAPLRQAIREGRAVRTVLRNFRKDGKPFWNELYLSPILNAQGRLVYFVGIQNDVTMQVELKSQLEFLAHHDMLTGLANRPLLVKRLNQALVRARRTHKMVAVLFFDLDNFKVVNDMFGHDAGDLLLKEIADRLREGTRAHETIARLGGDEFIMVIEDLASEEEGIDAMRRLEIGISGPLDISGHSFHPSASIGIGFFPRDGHTPEDLLRVADMSMYKAKYSRKETGNAMLETHPVPKSR